MKASIRKGVHAMPGAPQCSGAESSATYNEKEGKDDGGSLFR